MFNGDNDGERGLLLVCSFQNRKSALETLREVEAQQITVGSLLEWLPYERSRFQTY